MIRRLMISATLILVYLVARVPYLENPLRGEEGMFAHILLEAPQGGANLLVGRVNGEAIYAYPEHPIAPYKLMALVGDPFKAIVQVSSTMPESDLVPRLRFTFSLFLLAILLLILWLAYTPGSLREPLQRNAGPLLLILAVAISPLALTTSIGLQLDAGPGILMVGILPAVILAFHQGWIAGPTFGILAGFGALLTGLGKQEWSLALLIAIAATLVYVLLLRGGDRDKRNLAFAILASMLSGLVLGNLISYWSDPINYAGGLNVMTRIIAQTGYVHTVSLDDYKALFHKTLSTLLTPLMLVLLLASTSPRWLRGGNICIFLLAVYGLALLVGFVLSPHAMGSGEARYFMPSVVVLLCAGLAAFPTHGSRWERTIAGLSILTIMIPAAPEIYEQISDRKVWHQASTGYEAKVIQAASSGKCFPIIRADQGYRASFDFVSYSIPELYQLEYAERAGRPLCPPFGDYGAPLPALVDGTFFDDQEKLPSSSPAGH